MRASILVLLACACSKSKKPEEQPVENAPPGSSPSIVVRQDLPAELAFTCERILPKAIREVVFPDGRNLRGGAHGKTKFYACELETDEHPLVIELDCNSAALACESSAEVGRIACIDGATLRFVPSKLDCIAKLVHADAETALELAHALDGVYTKATVTR